jgi:hypothetical protein
MTPSATSTSTTTTGVSTNSTPEFPNLPIIDGLMYNPLLRYLPQRSLPLVYEKWRKFRTGAWQPRLYCVPSGIGGAVVMAGATVTAQIRTAVSGCELIGWNLATLTDSAASFGVVVVDSDAVVAYSNDDGYSFANGIDRYVIGGAFSAGAVANGQFASGQRFVTLYHPYLIVDNLLSVKLANLSTTDNIQVQFVLYVMEPVNAS